MPRGGGGTYALAAGNPVVVGTNITTTWANPTLEDIRDALTDSLSRSGLGGMTAALRGTDGTAAAPAYSFTSELDTGMYLVGSNSIGFSTAGVQRFQINDTGGAVLTTATGTGLSMTVPAAGVVSVATDGTVSLQTKFGTGLVEFGTIGNHGLNFLTNASTRITVGGSGNVAINAPTSGTALTVTGFANVPTAQFNGAATGTAFIRIRDGQALNQEWDFRVGNSVAQAWELFDVTRNARVLLANATGNVTISAPSTGTALTVNGTGSVGQQWSDGTITGQLQHASSNLWLGSTTNHGLRLFTNGTQRFEIAAGGAVAISAPSSGQALTVNVTTPTSGGVLALGNTTIGTDNTSQVRFNNQTSASASAGGGASLPATILGYLAVNVNASQVKIPYYAV